MLKLKIPPPIYMLLLAGFMWLLNRYFPISAWLTQPWNQAGWALIALSFIPAMGAFWQFTRFKTTINPHHPEKASTLVTTGVYQFSRNPMYLNLFLLLMGWAIYLGSLSPLLLPLLFIWVITSQQIKSEEQVLEKVFGQEYLSYKQKVRRWV